MGWYNKIGVESIILKCKNVQRVLCARGVRLEANSTFEGKNKLGRNVYLKDCQLGKGTYISDDTVLKHVSVGRYCSLGSNIKIVYGQHPSSVFVSTHPCFYSKSAQAGFSYVNENYFQERRYADVQSERCVCIGNDVWIGDEVKILEGLKIGDGSIVAAGAIVTKNVPPYAIVGGVPAKIIRYRFSKEIIERLIKKPWWEMDEQWIEEHSPRFIDIQDFLKVLSQSEEKNGEAICNHTEL